MKMMAAFNIVKRINLNNVVLTKMFDETIKQHSSESYCLCKHRAMVWTSL